MKAVSIFYPPVAILYTTYNDFVEASLLSCLNQNYPCFKVYVLDDSTDPEQIFKINQFADFHSSKVKIIRRKNRKAFKAGNLNHALEYLEEPYFAIADADEILPSDFLDKTVRVLDENPSLSFVQANHKVNPYFKNNFTRSLGIGIDIHWKWYQPLRNKFGFVMFLGHGALLRKKCWEEIGGFPEIVSEDLGYALRCRNLGYRGYFMEDVICYEDFPETVRNFRIRHMKWTKGTCEFLDTHLMWLMKAKNIPFHEKLDILFPTLNLPLTIFYFIFMINANLILPVLFSEWKDVTFYNGNTEFVLNSLQLNSGFNVINGIDFYIITVLTFISPVLCFIVELFKSPLKLFKFLSGSTIMYAALSPLTTLGVIGYIITRKANFFVTGDSKSKISELSLVKRSAFNPFIPINLLNLFVSTHPDQKNVRRFEIFTGLIFGVISLFMLQFTFLGLCLAFMILPVLHFIGWENKYIKPLIYLPFILVLIGLTLPGFQLLGFQTSFFGIGFHF